MKIFYLPIVCLMVTVIVCKAGAASSEFVQPKKQIKRVSVDTLKKHNIECCSDIFDSSAMLVEGLGKFQKNLKQCINKTFEEETRIYHENVKAELEKAAKLLEQMEELLKASEECIKSSM